MKAHLVPIIALGASLACLSAVEVRGAEEPKPPAPSVRVPEMFSLNPGGAREGATVRVEILGENLEDAMELEVEGSGVKAKILEASRLQIAAEFTVQPGADEGIRSVRLLSRLGVSNLLGFRVGALPETRETEPNDDRDHAHRLESPGVVDALLYPDEDTDFYRFHARAGQRLRIEVLAARNGSGLNAEMYLLDASGNRLSIGDDEAGPDPVIEYSFEKDGDYFVVVRGVFSVLNISFPTGHPAYVYQLRMSSSPELENIAPSAILPGAATEVEISGSGLDTITGLGASTGIQATILSRSEDRIRATLTANGKLSGVRDIWADSTQGSSQPLRVGIAEPIPLVYETSNADSPQRVDLPATIVGIIEQPGETDHYAFSISAPGAYYFQVEAGQLNSLLDSILTLYDAKGETLFSNDNGIFEQPAEGDSKFLYRFSEPGVYRLEVKQAVLDLHGPKYEYRLVAREARPRFRLTAAAGGQEAPWVKSADRLVVSPGSEITIPVNVEWIERLETFGEEVQLTVEGLPGTIEVKPYWTDLKKGKYTDNSRYTARVQIPLSIPPEAALGNYTFRVTGKTTVAGEVFTAEETVAVSASGRYVMAATGGFSHAGTKRYLSIVEPMDFTLRPEIGDERYPIRFTMQPGTIKTLPITILPTEKFPPDLEFSAENLPRGLTIHHVEPSPDKNQYLLHLKAAPDGETGWFPLVTFVAKDASTGVAVPTPYFGMAVQ